ncbi:MAG: hypothetical protein HYZ09_01550, partial [Candidatus Kerfeldbacteria bacterium]|nr:hypothetical protein [Candidatus Kerfeldbacteria bacterium]
MEASETKQPALYRDILKQAWRLVWKYAWLLILGFFAALTANGEQFDVLSKNVDTVVHLQGTLPLIDASSDVNALDQFWSFLRTLVIDGSFLSTDRFEAVLLFFAVMITPIVIAQAGIIAAAKRFVSSEEGKPTFGTSLAAGGRHFLPVLILNVVLKVGIYVLLGLVTYPLFLRFLSGNGSQASIDLLAGVAFVILVPLHIIFSFLTKFAAIHVIAHGKTLRASIGSAWRTFSANWLIAIEMSFILILINIVAATIVVGTVTFAFQPTGQFTATLYWLSLFFVGAFLAVFQYAAWTILLVR